MYAESIRQKIRERYGKPAAQKEAASCGDGSVAGFAIGQEK